MQEKVLTTASKIWFVKVIFYIKDGEKDLIVKKSFFDPDEFDEMYKEEKAWAYESPKHRTKRKYYFESDKKE